MEPPHHQHHLGGAGGGPPGSHHGGGGAGDTGPSPVPTSKSAFIELQQHPYNTIRSSYHPHHFSHQSPQPAPGSVPHHHSVESAAGFPSPRPPLGGGYPFSQSPYGYLTSYSQQCPSPTKDGKFSTCNNTYNVPPPHILHVIIIRTQQYREKCSQTVVRGYVWINIYRDK